MPDERTPLMQFPGQSPAISTDACLGDQHSQFCHLVGVRPLTLPPGAKHNPHQDALYRRAIRHRRSQGRTYAFTAALTNTLLLTQVVLGAALTGLGASDSPGLLIAVFGAFNTVIAGVVAFMKSRGQPMRARMFRDDLERVVDEIENSATMWFGVSRNAHGYDAIDTDEQVTVRSEVARLTRLYEKAVKCNTANDPDNYSAGASSDPSNAGLKSKPGQSTPPAAPATTVPATTAPVSATPAASLLASAPVDADPDASPATKSPEHAKQEPPKPTDAIADGNDHTEAAGIVTDKPASSEPDKTDLAALTAPSVTDSDKKPAASAVRKHQDMAGAASRKDAIISGVQDDSALPGEEEGSAEKASAESTDRKHSPEEGDC